jgi:putative nucleotidyltransferase with HDIG domain
MFIHGFEGSWLSHPFWRRKFLLEEPGDLTALLDSEVIGVIIDTAKGLDLQQTAPSPVAAAAPTDYRPPSRPAPRRTPTATPLHADDIATAEAKRTVTRSKTMMRGVLDGARLGKAIETATVMTVVEDVSSAIEGNRQALLRVLRLKSKDEYTYLHSVAVCALMVALSRQLGLDDATTAEMGTAGLLHDVGKMTVPLDVLNKPARLTDEEFALMQTHPEKGFRLLEQTPELPALALDVCRHHHEKMDGTGYPHRLKGHEISLAARMGAICDVYDALTSNRAYKAAWSPTESVTRMRDWDGQFDPEILFAFMKSIGVFAIGMVVQLRTNRLGLIIDPGRGARAKAVAFHSTGDNAPIEPALVTIGDDLSHDSVIAEADPAAWGIDPATVAALAARYARA